MISEETRQRMSKSQKGRTHSQETKLKISKSHIGNKYGRGNYGNKRPDLIIINKKRTGIPLKPETKAKISKINKGKSRSEEYKRKMSEKLKGNKFWVGRKHSEATKRKMSESSKGEKNHFWNGGINPITLKIRSSFEYNRWRQTIFIRDNFTCQNCAIFPSLQMTSLT